MTQYIRTGEMKRQTKGLADFLAEGYIIRDGERIPCQIGYTEWMDQEDNIHIDADYIFIKEGITDAGTHYNAETIEVFDREW